MVFNFLDSNMEQKAILKLCIIIKAHYIVYYIVIIYYIVLI